MNTRVIILDFDGTIVESADIKDWGWQVLFRDYGSAAVMKVMQYHRAYNHLTRYEKFRYIVEEILEQQYTSEREEQLDARYTQLVFDRIVSCPFVVGAEEFLNYFFEKCPLYVVTVNPQEYFEKLIDARGLRRYFSGVYTSPWKKGDALRDVLTKERCAPREGVYIGDTLEDYEVAHAMDMPFVGRDSGRFYGRENFSKRKNMYKIKKHLLKEG